MEIHRGPDGLILEIDTDDAATPAMVRSPCEQYCSTYDCAVFMGEIEDAYELSRAQLTWLDKFSDSVESAFYKARRKDHRVSH